MMKHLLILAMLLIAATACGTATAQAEPDVRVIGFSCGWIGSGQNVNFHAEVTAVNLTGERLLDVRSTVRLVDEHSATVVSVPVPYIGEWSDEEDVITYKRSLNISRLTALKVYDCQADFTELGEPLQVEFRHAAMWGDHPDY